MIGERISRYQILTKLGEGGMGVVYKAEDAELGRTVALKFLPHAIAAQSDERQRFKIEARAAAALNHPNIATIYNIEETDNQLFLVMEYIEGQELKEIVGAENVIPMPDVLNYTSQIASGLQAAHDKGVIHRDIKPSNIMITSNGEVKIMDFGLAKMAGSALTQVGMTLGTVSYMSPEQSRGDKIDHRTDIWALGVVLYEMLTGEQPFRGHYEQAIIYSILNEPPEPLSTHRPHLSPKLEQIIAKTLEKNPDDRYQSADELRADLQALVQIDTAEQPSTSGPAPARTAEAARVPSAQTGERAEASEGPSAFGSKKLVMGATVAVVVIVLGIITYLTMQPGSSPTTTRDSSVTQESGSKSAPVPPETVHSTLIQELAGISETDLFLSKVNEFSQTMQIEVGTRSNFDPPDGCYVFVLDEANVRAAFHFADNLFHSLASEESLSSLSGKYSGNRQVWVRDLSRK